MKNNSEGNFITECLDSIREMNHGDRFACESGAISEAIQALRLLEGQFPHEDVNDLISAFRSCISRDYGGFNNTF